MDIFEKEQNIHNNAMNYINSVKNGMPCCYEEFEVLADEYGKLLKYLRRITRFSDKTASELFYNNAELSEKIHRDPMTGLFNRRFLEESMARNIKELSRSGSQLSLLMIDIDFFKKFNDTYGHSAGDSCIKSIGEAITGCFSRDSDFVARYGGEEFVVVLPYTNENGVKLEAQKTLESVIALNIPHKKNTAANCVTVSIGAATAIVKHTHKSDDYIKCADEALYMSKDSGRNRITFKQFI